MEITTRKEAGCTIVDLSGTLDDQTTLADDVGRMLDDSNPRIILDLSKIKMITSAGLSVLVQLTARSNTQGSKLALAAPSPFVMGVLQTTKLNRFFDLHANLSDAIQSVSA
ncbi:MAG: STAS domain-containing protein [Planctomycetes bacterium]|nr:STAS domain-containing protein [Planctomycetota bacterium]